MKIIKYLFNGIRLFPVIIIKLIYYFIYGLIITISIFPRYLIIGIRYALNPNKAKEIKYKNKPIITILLITLSLSIYLLSVFIFSSYSVQKLRTKYLTYDILNTTGITNDNSNDTINQEQIIDTPTEEENTSTYQPNDYWDYMSYSYLNIDFNTLKQKNKDTVAWLKINNTNINYPIVQTSDNGYYLNHDYSKNYNMGGWVYGDYRNNFNSFDKNTIIYGHNLINKTMFGSLPKVLNSSWYNNQSNQVIKMSTLTNNSLWQIFSVYTTASEAYYTTTKFSSNDEYLTFLNTIKTRSKHNFNIDLDESSKILTLTTCTDDGTARVVVHAKMVSISYK